MKKLTPAICLLTSLLALRTLAEPVPLHPFGSGSYQAILAQHQNRPLILVLWSLTCSSCMKEMGMLGNIAETHPNLSIVLVSVDDFSVEEQVQEVLQKNKLGRMSNWLFTEANSDRLRYQIDPDWYGELPRTYFFSAVHDRTGVSGALSEQDYRQLIDNILP